MAFVLVGLVWLFSSNEKFYGTSHSDNLSVNTPQPAAEPPSSKNAAVEATQLAAERFNAMKQLAGRLKGKGRAKDEQEAERIYIRWHNTYAQAIGTPLEESLRQFRECYRKMARCNTEIPAYEVTAEEMRRICSFPKVCNVTDDDLMTVGKLALDAKKHADTKGRETFFISNRTIAERLKCSNAKASRLRKALCSKAVGFMQEVKKGHTGKASEFLLIEEPKEDNGNHSVFGDGFQNSFQE